MLKTKSLAVQMGYDVPTPTLRSFPDRVSKAQKLLGGSTDHQNLETGALGGGAIQPGLSEVGQQRLNTGEIDRGRAHRALIQGAAGRSPFFWYQMQ